MDHPPKNIDIGGANFFFGRSHNSIQRNVTIKPTQNSSISLKLDQSQTILIIMFICSLYHFFLPKILS